MEASGRLSEQPQTIQGQAEVHVLRWSSIRHWITSLWTHTGWNNKGIIINYYILGIKLMV